jgi:hypothetical protein
MEIIFSFVSLYLLTTYADPLLAFGVPNVKDAALIGARLPCNSLLLSNRAIGLMRRFALVGHERSDPFTTASRSRPSRLARRRGQRR